MIERALVVANGKGGVGKSSVVAGVGGCLALGDWKVLLVDLDPQANLSDELGVENGGVSGGQLRMSCMSDGQASITPLTARPNLDLIAANEEDTTELADWLTLRTSARGSDRAADGWRSLSRALAPIASRYDLIIIDTPPADNSPLARLALGSAHWVVSPTKRDFSSMKGISRLAGIFSETAAEINPDLVFLGAILFDLGSSETAERRTARAALETVLAGQAPVFTTIIPSAPLGSTARNAGMLSYEYEAAAGRAKKDRLAALRRKERLGAAVRFGANASQLAQAYRDLADEIVGAMFGSTSIKDAAGAS